MSHFNAWKLGINLVAMIFISFM